jgi:hypothetical protein
LPKDGEVNNNFLALLIARRVRRGYPVIRNGTVREYAGVKISGFASSSVKPKASYKFHFLLTLIVSIVPLSIAIRHDCISVSMSQSVLSLEQTSICMIFHGLIIGPLDTTSKPNYTANST